MTSVHHPPRMPVTTRIIISLVGNPNLNLHLPLASWVICWHTAWRRTCCTKRESGKCHWHPGWGVDPTDPTYDNSVASARWAGHHLPRRWFRFMLRALQNRFPLVAWKMLKKVDREEGGHFHTIKYSVYIYIAHLYIYTWMCVCWVFFWLCFVPW